MALMRDGFWGGREAHFVIGEVEYVVEFVHLHDETAMGVDFYVVTGDTLHTGPTGLNINPFAIYATVAVILREFLDQHALRALHFRGSTERLARMYRSLIKYINNKNLIPGYIGREAEPNDFRLERQVPE